MKKGLVLISCFLLLRALLFAQTSGTERDTFCAYTINGHAIHNVSFDVVGGNPAIPPFWLFDQDSVGPGCRAVKNFGSSITFGTCIKLIAATDESNGVTLADFIYIWRHLKGLEIFNSPYQFIAADATATGYIDSVDVTLLEDFLLKKYWNHPNAISWVFPNSNYPLSLEQPFPPINAADGFCIPLNDTSFYDLIGVKIGDVDFDAVPNPFDTPQILTTKDSVEFYLSDVEFQAGETFILPLLTPPGNSAGITFSFKYDTAAIELNGVEYLPGTGRHNSAEFPASGRVVGLCYNDSGATLTAEANFMTLHFNAKINGRLKNYIQLNNFVPTYTLDTGLLTIHPLKPVWEATNNLLSLSSPINSIKIYPNPGSGPLTLEANLTTPINYSFELLDAQGRRVYFQRAKAETTFLNLQIPATALETAGLYFWVFSAGKTVQTGQLIKN